MKALANEKVVYILGAGFSAQFGLPVMSNFLEKSKDMYALKEALLNKEINVNFFGDVYQEIDKLRRCKDFYASDMTNIEEILSLFEMGKMLGSQSKQQINFQKFIAEVINYHTANINDIDDNEIKFKGLFSFLLHIFSRTKIEDYVPNMSLPNYSILTFNYDHLLENVLLYCIRKKRNAYMQLQLIENEEAKDKDHVSYIKLHGDASKPQTIVTPTWKKAFDNEENNNWKIAGKLLSEANHIRIIGYSLPVTDSYLKYFLKWGAAHEQNLKSIDVICLDDEQHSVEKRYRDFIHHKLNFYNKSTKDYLSAIRNGIEEAHQNLFKNTTNNNANYSF